MRLILGLIYLLQHCTVSIALSSFSNQLPFSTSLEEGVGHFSAWSKDTKRSFIDDVREGKAQDWTIVMGNEGGGKSPSSNEKELPPPSNRFTIVLHRSR